MVSLLLEHNTKVCGSPWKVAAMALRAACEAGHERTVQRMLTSQPEARHLKTHYKTAVEFSVMCAACHGHVDLVRSLLDRGTFSKKENVTTKAFLELQPTAIPTLFGYC